jgi:hypothetical protein
MVCPERKKSLSLARRGGRCTTRNLSRVASRRPLPSSSSLVFRRHRSPFRSPARPPPPNPTLSRFCCSGCRNCSTSAATYSQRITRVQSMDSISRTNEHSLLTSYYSTRTTYNIRTNTSQLKQQQREQQPQNQQVPKLQVREAASVSVILSPSCLIELTHAFVSLLLLGNCRKKKKMTMMM